jgi:hypothetical protein
MSEHKYKLLPTNYDASAEFVELDEYNTDYRSDSDYDECECNNIENCCYSCFSCLTYYVPCCRCLWVACYQTAECVCTE